MNRRSFLASLAGGAAFALDQERALWVRGAKTISIPRLAPAGMRLRVVWGTDPGTDSRTVVYVEFTPGEPIECAWRPDARIFG